MELSEFYNNLETDKQLSDEDAPHLRTDKYSADLKAKSNPAQGLMYLGEKQKEVAQELNTVDKMLKDVVSGVTGALNSLIQKFSSNNFGVCEFKLPYNRVGRDGSLLDEFGNVIEHYGVKEIINEEQRKRLKRDFEIAMLYLPQLRMQEMKTADKKDIMLVTGADSSEFNAVVKAHREKERLSKELEMLGKEKDGLMKNMGLNPALQVTSDGNRTPDTSVVTPVMAAKDGGRGH